MLSQSIHISVASNNYYAVLLAALLKSIIVNHKTSEKLVFYVFDDQISSSNKEKVSDIIINHQNVEINWLKASQILPPDLKFPIDNSAFPFTAFLRLFAPYNISEELNKLIYLDVDMIVNTDISKLWEFDLQDYTLAAVVDVGKTVSCAWGGIPNYKQLAIPADAPYFNSGLMIINPKLWREKNIPQKVFKAMNDNLNFVNYADQYGLNVVFAQNWKEIDPLWNWYAHNPHPNPFIIHFLDIKPIFKSYKSDPKFRDEFFKYLELTPFKGTKLKSEYVRLLRKAMIKIKKKSIKVFPKIF